MAQKSVTNSIDKLYQQLRKKYGKPGGHHAKRGLESRLARQWSIWAKRPKTEKEKEQIIIEAILTQRTNWRNVQIAMDSLKRAKANSLKRISKFKNENELAPFIKSSGFYKQKSGYLIDLAKFIIENGGIKKLSKMAVADLRLALLKVKGVGPETADSILLYALEKPVFVIDEYTRRLLSAKGISPRSRASSLRGRREKNYEKFRELFEKNLPKNWRLYQDFHALIVVDGKNDKIKLRRG